MLVAIAGYVLGKATARGSSAEVKVVSDKMPENEVLNWPLGAGIETTFKQL